MSMPADLLGADPARAAGPAPGAGLPRLLAAAGGGGGAEALARHRRTYPEPMPPGRPRGDLIAAVERSGLRGRGGASFPTGRKLRAVLEGGRSPVVVVNGAEGEPASGKDKLLLSVAPHLVIDGALLAAAAVGAREVIVCVDQRAGAALGAVRRALAERRGEAAVPLRLATVPSRYVAGEETALVHWLNGGPAKPTRTPPRPFQRGVEGLPTLVDNVETLAHLAQIIRFGPDWFRQLGTPDEPGSALFTISGAVARPGVYELPIGTALRDALRTAGGPPAGAAAVLVGGFYGSWLDAEQAGSAALSNLSLRPLGAGLGCGALVVLPEGVCGVAETARILAWLAGESAGQCGPCVYGLGAIAATTAQLAGCSAAAVGRPGGGGAVSAGPAGAVGRSGGGGAVVAGSAGEVDWPRASGAVAGGPAGAVGWPGAGGAVAGGPAGADAVGRLRRWAGQVEGRGACRLPDGAVRLLRSALRVFADDVERHARDGGCLAWRGAAAGPSPLPMPARTPTRGGSPWR